MDTKDILEMHRKTKFPSFPNDNDFAEWVEDLIDLDGYYYGLASSILGGVLKAYDISLFQNLKQRLSKFKNLEDDKDVYHEFEEYLTSLESVVELIKAKNLQ